MENLTDEELKHLALNVPESAPEEFIDQLLEEVMRRVIFK